MQTTSLQPSSEAHGFDAEVLARVKGLTLRSRLVAEGVFSGLHRSRHRGYAAEFVEHREYQPGDDLRYVDWKAFGRRDKLSLKRYEEDTHIRCTLLLDASASMGYAHGEGPRLRAAPTTKLEFAKVLVSSLSYLLLHQGDAVGLVIMQPESDRFSALIPARSERDHFHALALELARVEAKGQGSLSRVVALAAGNLSRKGMVFLFSDLLGDWQSLVGTARTLQSQGHDLVVFHVLDRAEVEFPFVDPLYFEDLESPEKILVDPKAIRTAYRAEVDRYLEEVRASCLAQRVDYERVFTDEAAEQVLLRFLRRRTG